MYRVIATGRDGNPPTSDLYTPISGRSLESRHTGGIIARAAERRE